MVQLSDTFCQEIVRALRSVSDPDLIILHGSRAHDNYREDSDIDLLVVEPKSAWKYASRRKEMSRLRQSLPRFDTAIDLLLFTPEEIEQWKYARNHLVHHALKEGCILHE